MLQQTHPIRRPPHCALVHHHPTIALEELAHFLDVGVRVVGEEGAEALFVLVGDLEGTAGAGACAFLFGQPDLAAVVVELFHGAGFVFGDGVGGHDCFDVVAGGEVGFDAGTHCGGKAARHGCFWLGGDSKRGKEWKEMLVFELMALVDICIVGRVRNEVPIVVMFLAYAEFLSSLAYSVPRSRWQSL